MTGHDSILRSRKFRESVAEFLRLAGVRDAEAEPLRTATSLSDRGDILGIDGWRITSASVAGTTRYGEGANRLADITPPGFHGAAVYSRAGQTTGESFVVMRLADFASMLAERQEDSMRESPR